VEENDIVYRTADSTLTVLPSGTSAAVDGDLHLDVDPTLLFRFSALTYNAHRIHYDRDYAAEEGYPHLVVHGPLQVLMMGELLRRRPVDLIGRELSFRLVAPMIGPQRLTVSADPGGDAVRVLDGSGKVTATSVLGEAPRA
jgi:3-methylfumaryl-CoA hydratase